MFCEYTWGSAQPLPLAWRRADPAARHSDNDRAPSRVASRGAAAPRGGARATHETNPATLQLVPLARTRHSLHAHTVYRPGTAAKPHCKVPRD